MDIDNKKRISLEFLNSIGILNHTELTKCIEAIYQCELETNKNKSRNSVIDVEYKEYCQKTSVAYNKDGIDIVYYGIINNCVCISISNRNNYILYLNSNTELHTLSDSDTICGFIQIQYPINIQKEHYITIKPKETLLLYLSYMCGSFKITSFEKLQISLSIYRYNKNLNKINMNTMDEIDKICSDPRFKCYNIKLKLSSALTCESEILQYANQKIKFR